MTRYGCPTCTVPPYISVPPTRKNCCAILHSSHTLEPHYVLDVVKLFEHEREEKDTSLDLEATISQELGCVGNGNAAPPDDEILTDYSPRPIPRHPSRSEIRSTLLRDPPYPRSINCTERRRTLTYSENDKDSA